MSVSCRDRACGFTLVELLVAVLVFGLLAAAAYGGLNTLTAVSGQMRERAAALAGVQRAVATLDGDLRQLVGRTGRDRDGRLLPALRGGSTTLLARRAGRANPAGLARSTLQQFSWRVENDVLVRRVWATVDADPATAPAGRTAFEAIESIEFRFRDASGNWQRQWPLAGPAEALPAAVEYVVVSPVFGEIRRVIAL